MTENLEDYALQKQEHKKGSLKQVGIIGCGTMGQEIAIVTSQHGIDVVFVDLTEERIEEVFIEISKSLDEVISKWGMTKSEKKAILSRIAGSTDYSSIKDCDLVIETINSRKPGTNIESRKDVFRKVEAVVRRDTVIASNTSTLNITDLASVLEYPDRAVGFHFLSPASSVKLAEVVKGLKTSEESYDFVIKFAKMVEKKVITLHESPGNISTRLIVTLINEACETLMEGVASTQCIDETMKLGFGLQFGPLEMADRIGLDKVIKWMDNLYQEFGELNFKPNPVLKRLYRSGHIGKKSGTGFYKYKDGKVVGETVVCPEFNIE
ncbi:MAG: 3-hydroxyacyl-CoA dehydrogenase family protein [Bacteroidales bacterium]|nr:MAG: 3-hydroxyacyl-CoA dehydrogenase family protein [Bacteroidales bacterium]